MAGFYTDDIRLRVTKEQKEFLESKVCMSQYVRYLIEKEMTEECPERMKKTFSRLYSNVLSRHGAIDQN